MAMPLGYNLRNLLVRRFATIMSAAGVAAVVAVFVIVMGLAEGFRAAVATTGSERNAILLRDGPRSELQSAVDRGIVDILKTLPQIAVGREGRPLLSADMLIVINHEKRGGAGPTNVNVRGILPGSLELRDGVRLTSGRMFEAGSAEVIVGKALSGRVQNCEIGGVIRQGGRDWTVVGIFEAEGSSFESEIWGDAEVMLQAFQRRVYQSVTLRMRDPQDLPALAAAVAGDERLKTLQVFRQDIYYAEQSEAVTTFIRTLGYTITIVMSIGAILGAMNTMYAAVANRTREIGTLRAIGFTPFSIFSSFLIECLVLSLIGAVAGALLALPVDGIATGTTNWASFSEVAFQFRITGGVLAGGVLFGLLMGVIGGAFPAWRAARLRIIAALRPA